MAVATVAALAFAFGAVPAWGASGGANPKPSQLNAARLGPVRSGPVHSGTGIVQAVRPHGVVVRQLDGRKLFVPIGARTAVSVNGSPATLADLRPGFVVAFTARARGVALTLHASNPSGGGASAPKAGAVQSVSGDAVVVAGPNGGTVTIAVAARTQVFLNGSPVTIGEIAAGDRLVKVGGDASGQRPARVLHFRRPG
jgi:hypothetical protein